MAGRLKFIGVGSETQIACGFADSKKDMFTYLMMTSGLNADEAKQTCRLSTQVVKGHQKVNCFLESSRAQWAYN